MSDIEVLEIFANTTVSPRNVNRIEIPHCENRLWDTAMSEKSTVLQSQRSPWRTYGNICIA